MPKPCSANMLAYLAQKAVPALATFWVITRLDGAKLYFTDWSEPVTAGGVTYWAASGMSRSAVQQRVDLAVPGFEAVGFVGPRAVTDKDIAGGAYDGATVEVFIANPLDVDADARAVIALASGATALPNSVDVNVTSPSGQLRLEFQTDGNLVLREEPGDIVVWASNTYGMGVTGMTMQSIGNLVIYAGATTLFNSAGAPITVGAPVAGSHLYLRDNGQVVVEPPDGPTQTWESRTTSLFSASGPRSALVYIQQVDIGADYTVHIVGVSTDPGSGDI